MKKPIRKKSTIREGREGTPKIGPATVRAWFDTVINPLLRILESEGELLRVRNWTWRVQPGALEMLRRIESNLDPEVRDNLEQITEDYSDIRALVDEHDHNVEQLSECCKRLHEVIVQSQDLLGLYERATSPDSLSRLGAGLPELFGAYPRETHLGLLAQYIVNNTGQLPEYYSPSRLWNFYRDEFIGLLDRPSIRKQQEKTVKAGDILSRSVERLLHELKVKRHRLSREHDVPYVSSDRFSARAAESGLG